MSTASFRGGVWAVGYAAAIAMSLVTVGCGGTSAPTRPSPSSPAASSTVAGPAQTAPVTISWSCLAQSAAGNAGIFSATIHGDACPTLSPALVFDGALAVPGAPPSLTSSVSGSTVALTWLVPTSPDPATSYVIEAGSSAGATNIAVFDTLRTATSFTATDVPAGTYFVRVRARNSAGTSAASNEVVVIVGGGACVSGTPSAPSGLTASVSGSSVSLSWAAPASGCAPTGYVIEAGSTPGSSNLANLNTGSTATTFSAGGVPAGTYYVRVRAARTAQSVSGPSNELVVIVGAPSPSSVTGTWVGLVANGEGSVTINDPECGIQKFDVSMTLVQAGSTVTGTSTRKVVQSVPGCDTVGRVSTDTVTGTVGSGTFSFTIIGAGNRTSFANGTFTATRMSGTFSLPDSPVFPVGTFIASKQQ